MIRILQYSNNFFEYSDTSDYSNSLIFEYLDYSNSLIFEYIDYSNSLIFEYLDYSNSLIFVTALLLTSSTPSQKIKK